MSFIGIPEDSPLYPMGKVPLGPQLSERHSRIVDVDFENSLVKIRLGLITHQEFDEEIEEDEKYWDLYAGTLSYFDVIVPFTAIFSGPPSEPVYTGQGRPIVETKEPSWTMMLPETDD